ncbi:FkbM family methyltransferase [Actinokineospora iranica]|uniref:Methyltransferase, FkbM family n=1 Tax=Actinokineospora iranica TaxID=1271860 RepID=A0A1G6QXC8_9PSEU|nr:FkbM family methyltransferase [Actinokineospora iranica]SDC96644.1 methyltransferase, FkbM family [Actinokineospora iranica]
MPDAPPADAVTPLLDCPMVACTVVAAADLPAARVTARSFLDHHPSARFVTLLVDGERQAEDRADEVLVPEDLGIGPAEFAVLATGHTAREACAALRPRLLEWLLGKHTAPVLYLDPWVRVYGPLIGSLTAALTDAVVVLVPKVLRPLPSDGLRPTQEDLLAAGVYDEGFVAVARGAEQFLHSWAEVCRTEPARAGGFLDGAPALVDHRVLRDPGLGLSRWNAGQRPLAKDPERGLTAGGSPLRVVNFAGFDPDRPWLLTAEFADHPRVLLSEHPLLGRVCADYAAELGDDEGPPPSVRFGRLADGTTFPAPLRAAYRAAQSGPADARPAAAGADPAAFLLWACAPVPDLPDATRWAVALWEDDPGLRERFPDPFGEDAAAYRDWCATDAILAGRLHQRAVPGQHGLDVALIDQIGVSVIGAGPLADRVRLAAEASGLPVSNEPVYPVVLTCNGIGGVPRNRHVITVRDEFAPVPFRADERWLVWPAAAPAPDGVATHIVPLPVADPGARDDIARDDARHALGFGAEPAFVAMADHADDLLAAFAAAFPQRADVRLILLVPASIARTGAAERLRLSTAAEPRVRLVVDESAFPRAIDAADWAVSVHEPNGPDSARVNRWLTDVSLRGVPIITVAGGTAVELLGADTCVALPVDEFAADTMVAGAIRDLADDIATADKIGSAARAHVLERLAPTATGAAVRRRVELAYRSWRAGRALTSAAEDDPLHALRAARHALHRRPDPDVGHKIPMAPQMRRAVLRVLNHYDAHLTSVLASLIDGIERTAVELVERQERLSTAGAGLDADLLRADLDLVVERTTQVAKQASVTGEEVARLRGELAGNARAVGELSGQVREVASRERADTGDEVRRLADALAASTARMDALEKRLAEQRAEQESRLVQGSWSAEQALRTTDALRRVVVRQHERGTAAEVPSSLVLCDAGLLRLPAQDSVMSAVLSSNGVWEPEVAELVDSLIEPDSVFLDVGAYVGYHAIRVLSRLGSSGTVVAVEPDPDAVKLLRHNVSENIADPVAEHLVVVRAAAWDSQSALVGAPAGGGGYAVRPQDPKTVTTTTSGEVAVPGVRLDRELEALAATRERRLSVVKVDVPGRGHRALGGLVRRLRKDRPHVVCAVDAALTSGFGDDPAVVLREFRTWGYELVRLGEQRAVAVDDAVDEVVSGQLRTLWLRPLTSR